MFIFVFSHRFRHFKSGTAMPKNNRYICLRETMSEYK